MFYIFFTTVQVWGSKILKWILLFSKLIKSDSKEKLQKRIYISNKCSYFELSIYQRIMKPIKKMLNCFHINIDDKKCFLSNKSAY